MAKLLSSEASTLIYCPEYRKAPTRSCRPAHHARCHHWMSHCLTFRKVKTGMTLPMAVCGQKNKFKHQQQFNKEIGFGTVSYRGNTTTQPPSLEKIGMWTTLSGDLKVLQRFSAIFAATFYKMIST